MANSSQKKAPDKAQAARFIKAAREAGCSEDEAEVRETMKRIATAKAPSPDASTK